MTTLAPVIGMTAICITELIVLCVGSWLFFRQRGHTNSEAAACGIGSTFIALAAIYQMAGLAGIPQLSWWLEAPFVIGAVCLIARGHRRLRAGVLAAGHTAYRYPLAALGLFGGLGYLALQGILIPTDAGHWDALARMLLLQRQHSDAVCAQGLLMSKLPMLVLPENHTILAHLFTRNHGDMGLGLLGLAAFTAIAFATYALSRRYAWPPAAMTVTLVAVSCPRFVLGAPGPGVNLIPAALGVVALLNLYRLVEHPNGLDFSLLVLAACFLIGDRTLWLGFPFILLLLGAVLVFRRHGVLTWVKLISGRIWVSTTVVFGALFLSRLWLYPFNGLVHRNWKVDSGFSGLPLNPDGIQGTAANLVRYLLQSVDLPSPLERGFAWLTQISISDSLQRLYTTLVYPLFGHMGAVDAFQLSMTTSEHTAWFGPLCLVLMPPAFFYGLRFAPRRLKAVLVALLGYVFLVSLMMAWRPENGRFFGVLYACGIFSISFFLPPWRLTLTSRKLLRWACFGLFFYACLFNAQKPAFKFEQPMLSRQREIADSAGSAKLLDRYLRRPFADGIWIQSQWGRNRWIYAAEYFGDRRADRFAHMVPFDACLLIVYNKPGAAFPFLLHYPNATAFSVSSLDPERWSIEKGPTVDYLLFADGPPASAIDMSNWQVLWRAEASLSQKPGILLKPIRINDR